MRFQRLSEGFIPVGIENNLNNEILEAFLRLFNSADWGTGLHYCESGDPTITDILRANQRQILVL